MSVFVKGMEMPRDCRECQYLFYDYGTTECIITGTPLAENYRTIKFDGRAKDCPLTEVPDVHGRLIDGDKLLEEYPLPDNYLDPNEAYRHITGIRASITGADTVIPAEDEMDSFIRIFEEDDEEDGMDSFIRILKD